MLSYTKFSRGSYSSPPPWCCRCTDKVFMFFQCNFINISWIMCILTSTLVPLQPVLHRPQECYKQAHPYLISHLASHFPLTGWKTPYLASNNLCGLLSTYSSNSGSYTKLPTGNSNPAHSGFLFFLTPSFHSKSARVSPFAENISLTLKVLLTLQIPAQAWPPPPCPLTGQLPLPQAITAPHSPSPSSWWQFYIHMWLWRSLIIHFTNKNYRL